MQKYYAWILMGVFLLVAGAIIIVSGEFYKDFSDISNNASIQFPSEQKNISEKLEKVKENESPISIDTQGDLDFSEEELAEEISQEEATIFDDESDFDALDEEYLIF